MAARQSAQRSLFLIDIESPANRLELQNVPLSLDYDFDNQIKAVVSPGRNNPFYFFTGSEDSLDFELSWYAAKQSRDDVIKAAKWLEGMSKNDGYRAGPKIVGLQWAGTSVTASQFQNEDGSFSDSLEPSHWDNQLFQFSTWIIKSAPYSMSLFHKTFNMLPTLATQKVKMLRATPNNSSRAQISDLRY
jgi:hypothetical protein